MEGTTLSLRNAEPMRGFPEVGTNAGGQARRSELVFAVIIVDSKFEAPF